MESPVSTGTGRSRGQGDLRSRCVLGWLPSHRYGVCLALLDALSLAICAWNLGTLSDVPFSITFNDCRELVVQYVFCRTSILLQKPMHESPLVRPTRLVTDFRSTLNAKCAPRYLDTLMLQASVSISECLLLLISPYHSRLTFEQRLLLEQTADRMHNHGTRPRAVESDPAPPPTPRPCTAAGGSASVRVRTRASRREGPHAHALRPPARSG